MADIYERLAAIEERDGDRAEAIELLDRALGVRLRTQGAMHPSVALTLERLAAVEEPANPSLAADFRSRALAIWERHLGPEHDVTLTAIKRLAESQIATRQADAAETLLLRALEITKRRHGDRHSQTAGLLVDLAAVARLRKQNGEAKRLFEEALAIYRSAAKKPTAAVAVCLHGLGEIAMEERDAATAVTLFRQVLEIDEAIYGPDHAEVGEDLLILATALRARGEYRQATELTARANAILRAAAAEEQADPAEQKQTP